MAKRKRAASEQGDNRSTGRFEKGRSGNPGGRPKGNEEFREACREHTPQALKTLLKWMKSKDGKAAIAAANSILDRGWGKATQPLSDPDGKKLMPTINITIGNERSALSTRPASPPKAG
jgi:hypothetical protein